MSRVKAYREQRAKKPEVATKSAKGASGRISRDAFGRNRNNRRPRL